MQISDPKAFEIIRALLESAIKEHDYRYFQRKNAMIPFNLITQAFNISPEKFVAKAKEHYKPFKLTPHEKELIKSLYKKGLNTSQIALKLNREWHTIKHIIIDLRLNTP